MIFLSVPVHSHSKNQFTVDEYTKLVYSRLVHKISYIKTLAKYIFSFFVNLVVLSCKVNSSLNIFELSSFWELFEVLVETQKFLSLLWSELHEIQKWPFMEKGYSMKIKNPIHRVESLYKTPKLPFIEWGHSTKKNYHSWSRVTLRK